MADNTLSCQRETLHSQQLRSIKKNALTAITVSTATAGGADICGQTESLARIYWRPALRKSFAAFPADSKVA